MTNLYRDEDAERQVKIKKKLGDGRNPYRRDWARLVHSASFRRLQGKTQLFPSDENDFYRNRLTHSLEVAQIASGIADNFNAKKTSFFHKNPISVDLVYFAGLAHDIGHPPFGHNGEMALDRLMARYGGFEGNAQTLRILGRLERKETASFPVTNEPKPVTDNQDNRYGLNVTYRSLASILKYDKAIPQIVEDRKPEEKNKPVKGYYSTELELVKAIKQNVVGEQIEEFKTIECGIMDIADDIAYSTYDLEDSFKDEWTSPIKILALSEDSKRKIIDAVNGKLKSTYPKQWQGRELTLTGFNDVIVSTFEKVFTPSAAATGRYVKRVLSEKTLSELSVIAVGTAEASSASLCHNGYLRGEFTSKLVNEFMNAVKIKVDSKRPQLSKVYLDVETFKKVELLKTISFQSIISSHRLKMAERRGASIIKKIFRTLADEKEGRRLLPEDWADIYFHFTSDDLRKRTICDFIANMTDRYCLEFYSVSWGKTHHRFTNRTSTVRRS